ncbi:MAG TPA: phenylalanine--tRNA ligase subunit beta, partial [Desulfatiglandales bacterium]|nr:phenylalanine--tRNA ligase subunit beta [Desulfatiglandales bacterium]
KSLIDIMDLEDWILEIALTPNRIDCASILGIAREIGALINKKIIMPEIDIQESDIPIEDFTSVTVLDTKGCPRYTAGLVDQVKIAPSPFWMRYRLHVSGIRFINNVVDITNYVLMELGQPLHAFDYHRLAENRIVVKRAENGQVFTTLDGQTRNLDDRTLMICDGKGAVALAGIMGGLNSEITPNSTTVLVESAYFDPIMIRRSSKRLSLSTEASYRFERGIDIEGVDRALKRSLMLMAQLTGGYVAKGIIDCYQESWSPVKITLRCDKTNKILGTGITAKEMSGYLSSLSMDSKIIDDDKIEVSPPSFRVDLSREADLIEEIARRVGYDNIPITLPAIRPMEGDTYGDTLRDVIKKMLIGMGFLETITYSFISPQSADILGASEDNYLRSFVRLLNPLSQDQSVMRTSLIPGILSTARLNSLRGQTDLRIFEWGRIYINGENELPQEKEILVALIMDTASRREWYQEARKADFFDIKGVAENILEGLGILESEYKRQNIRKYLDGNEYAGIIANDIEIGVIGKVSAEVMEFYELKDDAYILEFFIEPLSSLVVWDKKFAPLAKFPAVRRDISIIVNNSIESYTLISIAKDVGKDLIESVDIFDIYQGKNIGAQEKALAIRINYRSKDRTLTDHEVNEIHEEIIDKIRSRTDGRLRDGSDEHA